MRKHLTGAVVAATAALLGLGTLTTPAAGAEAAPFGMITGKVTAEVGGLPLDDIAVVGYEQQTKDGVTLWVPVIFAETKLTGDYVLYGSPGTYRVQFVECADPCTNPTYASEFYDDVATVTEAQSITLADNQIRPGVNAALAPGYLVSGHLTDPVGEDVAEGRVAAYLPDGTTATYSATTEADGTYSMVVPAGDYRFGFTDKDGTYGEFFEDERTLATADSVSVSADVPDLDVQLDLVQVQNVTDAEPTIHGIKRVGDTLAAAPGLWYPFSDQYGYTYAWFRSGSAQPIGTGSTLLVPQAAQGETITVQVTASLDGYTSNTASSAPTDPIAASPVALKNTAQPAISGTVKVGGTVKVNPGSWETTPSQVSYQWAANGKAIPGATTDTFTITPDLLGARLTVTVVAIAPGTLAGYSAATAPTLVQAGTIALTTAPTLTGKAKVGKRLKVVAGKALPASATVEIQWLVRGKVVVGATKKAYKLKKLLRGAKVRAQVTYEAPGYAPLVIRTRAVRIR